VCVLSSLVHNYDPFFQAERFKKEKYHKLSISSVTKLRKALEYYAILMSSLLFDKLARQKRQCLKHDGSYVGKND
jgi:hypothetical protein